MKGEKHTVISIDTEKACDKVQHTFMIKIVNEIGGIEGNYLNIIKAICEKTYPRKHILNRERLKAFL